MRPIYAENVPALIQRHISVASKVFRPPIQIPHGSQRLTEYPKYPLFAEHLQLLWGCSDFVGEQCKLHPDEFQAAS